MTQPLLSVMRSAASEGERHTRMVDFDGSAIVWRVLIGSSAGGHLEGTQNEIGQAADDGVRIIYPAGWLVATPAAIRADGIHADGEAFGAVTLRQWSQRADDRRQ